MTAQRMAIIRHDDTVEDLIIMRALEQGDLRRRSATSPAIPRVEAQPGSLPCIDDEYTAQRNLVSSARRRNVRV